MLARRAWRFVLDFWVYREVVVMKRTPLPAPDPPEFSLSLHRSYTPAVLEANRRFGRAFTQDDLRRRFERGLVFLELKDGEKTLVTGWMVVRSTRFVDELGYHFPIEDGAGWLRDFYVDQAVRGRRMFSTLADHLMRGETAVARVLWSELDTANRASLKAHLNCHFEIVETFRVLHICGLIMLRLEIPERARTLDGFKPTRRIFLTGAAFRRYRAKYTA